MKKIFTWAIFSLLMMLIGGCAQPVPPSQLIYTEVVNHNQTSNNAYELSKMWLANSFSDSKAVIEYDNKESGTVIGKGRFQSVQYGMMLYGKTSFTLEIEVKDNKSRITFSNMMLDFSDPNNPYIINKKPFSMWNMEQLENFKIPAKELVNNYVEYISKGNKKSDW